MPLENDLPANYFSQEEMSKRVCAQDPEILNVVRFIAEQIAALPEDPSLGGIKPRALLVGGFVRDSIAGSSPKDADMQAYGIKPDDLEIFLETLFPEKVSYVGQSFGVFKIDITDSFSIDLSIPRDKNSGVQSGSKEGAPTISVKEAALGRDFTINNFAFDPLSNEVFDFCTGVEDVKNGTLKISNTKAFVHYPIQVLRGAQLSARLGLWPDKECFTVMQEMVLRDGFFDFHPARVYEEFRKLFLKAPKPSLGLEILKQSLVFETHLPELSRIYNEHWEETLQRVDRTAELIRSGHISLSKLDAMILMFWALLKDFASKEDFTAKPSILNDLGRKFTLKDSNCAGIVATILNLDKVDRAIDKLNEKPPPSPTGPKKPGMFRKPAPQVSSDSDIVKQMLSETFPARWNVLISAFEVESNKKIAEVQESKRLHKIIIDNELYHGSKSPLITAEELMNKYGLPRGSHLGIILNEIESRRSELLTKQNAFEHVEKSGILKEVKIVEAKNKGPFRLG